MYVCRLIILKFFQKFIGNVIFIAVVILFVGKNDPRKELLYIKTFQNPTGRVFWCTTAIFGPNNERTRR